AQVHGLAYALRDEDALNVADALALRLRPNRLERFVDAGGRRVSVLAVPHGLHHGFNQVRRSAEVELQGVADVERQHLLAFARELLSQNSNIADGVADVFQARRRQNFADAAYFMS